MHRVWLFILVALVILPRAAWPQGQPAGPEFRVNTWTTGGQGGPSVAADTSGNFVVVWTGAGTGYQGGVLGQRYAASGAALGSEFQINTSSQPYPVILPAVAADAVGNFVVVWMTYGPFGGEGDVFGQRYANSGMPLGPEFRVNTYTSGLQGYVSAASDPAGNFVVVWTSSGQGGSFGQRYAASGTPLGSEFRVDTYVGSQLPSVTADPSGNFVVVWHTHDGSNYGIFGRRFASSGAPFGSEFRVNTYTTQNQRQASVDSDASGNFVVVWSSSSYGICGQRYASSGVPLGPEFRVNTYTTGGQSVPAVTSDASGNFAVIWHGEDGSASGIFGQRYDAAGGPLGPQFRVNTYTTNAQGFVGASIAADSPGNFVVVWQSDGQDGSGAGVYGQRYSQIVPVELMHFRVE